LKSLKRIPIIKLEAKYDKLLDIAGASGIYASAIVYQHLHMSASVFEKPPVDGIARNAIIGRDMQDKIDVIAGDMFKDEFPEGFDVHLFSRVLHDWAFSDVKLLLKNSYRNLNLGGRIMIHDAHITTAKNGPLPVAEYSVLLMFASKGKCYSISEMEYVPTVANRSVIIAEK